MLQVNNLTGFGIIRRPTVIWTDRKWTSSATNPVTHSACAISTASANRHVIVGVGIDNNSRTISGVTIGGVAATLLAAKYTSGIGVTGIQLWMYGALVPTGTTGDVVVTYSAACEFNGVVVWAAYGLTSLTPTDTATAVSASDGAAASTTALDVLASGIMIVHGYNDTDSSTHATTFVAADIEDVEVATTSRTVGGSEAFASTQTTQTLSCDPSGTSRVAIQAAAFA